MVRRWKFGDAVCHNGRKAIVHRIWLTGEGNVHSFDIINQNELLKDIQPSELSEWKEKVLFYVPCDNSKFKCTACKHFRDESYCNRCVFSIYQSDYIESLEVPE